MNEHLQSRVLFAEMLSILEMPNKDEWIVELVSSSWPDDPKTLLMVN